MVPKISFKIGKELVEIKGQKEDINSEDGLGALQFSFYQVPDPQSIIVEKELEEYLSKKYDKYQISTTANCTYSDHLADTENRYWKYWLFLKQNSLMLAYYNCLKEDAGKEDKTVNEIINSIDESFNNLAMK